MNAISLCRKTQDCSPKIYPAPKVYPAPHPENFPLPAACCPYLTFDFQAGKDLPLVLLVFSKF